MAIATINVVVAWRRSLFLAFGVAVDLRTESTVARRAGCVGIVIYRRFHLHSSPVLKGSKGAVPITVMTTKTDSAVPG
jgi:hypothetical protein